MNGKRAECSTNQQGAEMMGEKNKKKIKKKQKGGVRVRMKFLQLEGVFGRGLGTGIT